jgi:hypothetical protein
MNRTPLAIRVKCAALGIRIRRQRDGANEVRFGVDRYTWQQLKIAAERYCYDSVHHLMRHTAQIMVLDDLFSAVLGALVRLERKRNFGS